MIMGRHPVVLVTLLRGEVTQWQEVGGNVGLLPYLDGPMLAQGLRQWRQPPAATPFGMTP